MITYHDYNNKRIITTSPRVLAIHIYHHHGKQKLTFGPISNGTLSYPSRLCPGGSLQWSKCHGCTSHPPTAVLPGSDIDLPAKRRAPLFRRLVHQKWEQKDRDERRICVYVYEIQLHTWLLACLYLIHIYIPGQVTCIDVYERALESAFDSDVPKCAEISYRRKVLPDVANNKLHKRLEQQALHKKSSTKKKCVEGEWVGRKHLPTPSFNLRPSWPASRCDCTHLQQAPRQATSLQASQKTCHFADDLIGLAFKDRYLSSRPNGIETPGLEICHILPKGKVRKVRFWLRVRKQFRFSILEARKGSAQLVFIAFSSVSDFVLVSLVFVTFM